MKGFPDLPPIWMIGAGVVQWLLGQVTPVLRDGGLLGGLLILVGLLLILWSSTYFMRHKTPIEPHHKPKFLIVSGPYRISRNPIYLAMAIILTGWTLWLGVLAGLLVVPVFIWIINRRFISAEEAGLREAFGADADRFIDETARWIIR